jgi:hypothetical protein
VCVFFLQSARAVVVVVVVVAVGLQERLGRPSTTGLDVVNWAQAREPVRKPLNEESGLLAPIP